MLRTLTLDDLDANWRASGRWRLGAGPGEAGAMSLPVATVHIHHTVTVDTGDAIADVAKVCDIDQGKFGKVSYSWNVHPSTRTWVECEGLHRGAHTINNAGDSLNGISFGIGVVGNFMTQPAGDDLIALLAEGIQQILIAPGGLVAINFVIDGHRDVYATACCGDWLYNRLPDLRTAVAHPPQEDTMTPQPAQALDADGRIWSFVRGVDGFLWAQVLKHEGDNSAGIPSVLFDWFKVEPTFQLGSGPSALTVGGRILISARGTDGHLWKLWIGVNPASVPAPVGNLGSPAGWFDCHGLS